MVINISSTYYPININGILKATKEQKMQKEEQKKKTSISFTVHF